MRIYDCNDALKITSMPREASVHCEVKQAFSVVWLQFSVQNVAEQRKTKVNQIQTIMSFGLVCHDSERNLYIYIFS